MKAKVEGHPNLVKDMGGHVLHNRDYSERNRYRAAKAAALDRIEDKAQIQMLREELDELKDLMRQLLKNNGT